MNIRRAANHSDLRDENPIGLRVFGVVVLLLPFAASLIFVLDHFGMATMPGCDPVVNCDDVVASSWGAFLTSPVSFIGLAYFTGLIVAWTLASGSGVSMLIRNAVRLGALISVAFLVHLYVEPIHCIGCIVIHVSNLVFWVILERSQRPLKSTPIAFVTLVASFALVMAALHVIVAEQSRRTDEFAGRIAYESMSAADPDQSKSIPTLPADLATVATTLNVRGDHDVQSDPNPPITPTIGGSTDATVGLTHQESHEAISAQAMPMTKPVDQSSENRPVDQIVDQRPFVFGSDKAAIKLEIFSDYQSLRCLSIQRKIEELIAKYGEELSINWRHFPLCQQCNVSLSITTHPNACRAALAAEAAGALRGKDGFDRMHRWLFDQMGNFSDDQLKAGLVEMGYEDPDGFLLLMDDPSVLRGVLADIVEAQSRKIRSAPTVLINGQQRSQVVAGSGLDDAIAAHLSNNTNEPVAKHSISNLTVSPVDSSFREHFARSRQRAAAESTLCVVNPVTGAKGSGVIIAVRNSFVYALTAEHLVEDADFVEVRLFSEDSYPQPKSIDPEAVVLADSVNADLALLRFPTAASTPKSLVLVTTDSTSDQSVSMARGAKVLTVGCDGPDSAPTCAGTTIVDAKRVRRSEGEDAVLVWEVDEASKRGRSGGPLLDTRGLVIGIASGVSDGKGYFTHADEIHQFLKQNGFQALLSQKQSAK